VEHNCELLQSVAQHKNIILKFNMDANVPTFITGFPMYLDRVILNLLSNALKFTNTGSVEIFVSLKDKDTKNVSVGDSVTLECKVKDTGIGIPKDKFEVMSKPANPALLASHLEYFVFKAKQQEKMIDWGNMFLKYPDNQDFVKEMVLMFMDEVSLAKKSLTESFTHRDGIELRQALHRIRGAITYLILPQLEKSLEVFHQSVHDDWDDQNTLQKNYDAVMIAMDNFLKSASLS
jgi:hypothetical protein